MRFFKNIFALFFFGVSFPAFAADDSSEVFSIEFIAPIINHVFGRDTVQIFINAALGIATNLVPFAMQLAGLLAVISILWGLTIAMSSQKAALPILIEVAIFSSLTFVLLSNYATIVNDLASVGQKIMEAAGSSIGDAFQDFINSLIQNFMKLFNEGFKNRGLNIDLMKMLLDRIVAVVLLIFAFIVLMLAVKDLLGVLILGPVSLGVGVAIGPLLIATIPNRYTRSWVNGWVNFMISSAVITAVVVVVLLLMKNTITSVILQIVEQKSDSTGTTGKVVALAILIASMQQVFTNIPSMVKEIFPGQAGGLGKFTGTTASNMVKGIKQTASASGKTIGVAAGAAKGLKGAVEMAQKGFKNGQNSKNNSAQQSAQAFSQMTSSLPTPKTP